MSNRTTPFIELSKQALVPYKTLHKRIHYLKWDIQTAISTPIVTPRYYKKLQNKLANANSPSR